VTHSSDTIKLLDFGLSVSIDSILVSPSDEPVDPFQDLTRNGSGTVPRKKVDQIHPGTRSFAAPEVLRGECQDPLLADSYSLGMILIAVERDEAVDLTPWEQRKDVVPERLFVGCEVFEEHLRAYFKAVGLKEEAFKGRYDVGGWMRCVLPGLRHAYVTSRSTGRYSAQHR